MERMAPMDRFSPARQSTRRQLLGSTLAAVAAPYIVPGSALGLNGVPAPSSRLNVAGIGLGGRMGSLLRDLLGAQQNVVALCDIDDNQVSAMQKSLGDPIAGAKVYKDYRRLLESETSVDAVIISTPDHWHAPICKAAMHAGKHVYCEKPLTRTVAEARHLRELARHSQVVTQTGNQGSASGNLRRCIEVIQAGLLGQVHDIHVWHPKHGWPSGVDRPPGADPIPEGFDWDFWLGTSPLRPYKAGIYHPAAWRGWYDFGNGSLGDFCCHGFNLPMRALKLEYPTKIEVTGADLGKESFPTTCIVRYHFEKRGALAPVTLHFYTGGVMLPEEVTRDIVTTFGEVSSTGCLMVGELGSISAGLWNDEGRFKLRADPLFKSITDHDAAKSVPQTLPRVDSHMQEWVAACKGETKTFSNFDIGGHLTEIGLAGVIALRIGHDIEWDGKRMQVKGIPEARKWVKPAVREPWRREA